MSVQPTNKSRGNIHTLADYQTDKNQAMMASLDKADAYLRETDAHLSNIDANLSIIEGNKLQGRAAPAPAEESSRLKRTVEVAYTIFSSIKYVAIFGLKVIGLMSKKQKLEKN